MAVAEVKATADRLLRENSAGPFQLTNIEREWKGNTLHASLRVAVGPFNSPVKGTVEVTEDELIIECELPSLLTRMIPEAKIQDNLERKLKGLLAAPTSQK